MKYRLDDNTVLIAQYGKEHKKRLAGLALTPMVIELAYKAKLSKSKAKEMIKQGGVYVSIMEINK